MPGQWDAMQTRRGGGLVALLLLQTAARQLLEPGVETYLTKFGYLPQSDLETGMLRTLDQLEDAVRNLQGFAGLNMTGRIDKGG